MTPLMGTPNAEESALILARMVTAGQPFFFVRIGDGAIELLRNQAGHTCDGEAYHPALAAAMVVTIDKLRLRGDLVYWGDWHTATAGSPPKFVNDWDRLIAPHNRNMLDYESVLLMRRSQALLDFYAALKADRRRKLYIGAHYQKGAPALLGADFLPMPEGGVFQFRPMIDSYLQYHRPEVILFGAGMGGLVPIVNYWYEHARSTTCIHLGSALDPLFRGPTRSRQLPSAVARVFMKELL